MRPSKTDYYLGIAKAVAQRSTCLRRKYGAIIVKSDEIVGTGYNGSPRECVNCCDRGRCERMEKNVPHGEGYSLCEAVHAENNACIHAGRYRSKGGTLYLFGEESNGDAIQDVKPCSLCSKIIKNAGIRKVVTTTCKNPEIAYAHLLS